MKLIYTIAHKMNLQTDFTSASKYSEQNYLKIKKIIQGIPGIKGIQVLDNIYDNVQYYKMVTQSKEKNSTVISVGVQNCQ